MTRALILTAALACATLGGCASSGGDTMRFEARHAFAIEVPAGTRDLKAWFALPATDDPHQKVHALRVDAPHATREVKDQLGNRFLLLEVQNPAAGTMEVTTNFEIERQEVITTPDPALTRPHTPAELTELAEHLKPSSMEPMTLEIRDMATRTVGRERNPVRMARLLYDAVLEHMEYHVKDAKPDATKTLNASGKGSSVFAFEECTGNCTDFHALYVALARSVKLPCRVVFGSFFKGPLNGVDKDQSYHCWVEFHAPNLGWIPLDVAVADVFVADFQANEHSQPRAELTVADGYRGPDEKLVNYYFGNLDARRVVWHRGRDLKMVGPAQKGPPLLWNPKAYAELDGKPAAVQRKLTFKEL